MRMAIIPQLDLVLFVLLLMLLPHVDRASPCPSQCSVCLQDAGGQVTSETCTDLPLHSLPHSLTELHLSDAKSIMRLPLGVLRSFYLAGMAQLRNLSILTYSIKDISPGAFQGCPALTALDLSNNLVTQLKPGTFSGLQNLSYLNLMSNRLAGIPADSFAGLINLDTLNLALNNITTISQHAFRGLPRLTKLYLEDNSITTLQPWAFAGLKTVENIYLQYNKLTTVPAHVFPDLLQLQYLYLNDNNLSEIHNGAFKNVRLQVLYLNANTLSIIEPEAFKDSFILMIHLEKNNLHTLPEQVELSMNQSTPMVLYDNPWSCDCDIQWLANKLQQESLGFGPLNKFKEPVCASPANLINRSISMIVNDLQVACNNHASMAVPTRGIPVPPKKDLITPLLKNQTATPLEQADTDKGDNSKVTVIIICVIVAVILLVTMVVVTFLLTRSKIIPEAINTCKKPDINFRPRFSQWSLTERLQV